MTENLRSDGDFFTVDFGDKNADYPDLPSGQDGLFHQGVEVAYFISRLKAEQVRMPLTLIAHSNGGLAARSFLLRPDTTATPRVSAGDVSTVISYGTPHRGADFDELMGIVQAATFLCPTPASLAALVGIGIGLDLSSCLLYTLTLPTIA
jgi:hypothetical protein